MSTHKHIDKICIFVILLGLILGAVFMGGEWLGIEVKAREIGYESRIFDRTRVHTVDIVMDDWESFIENCRNEEYVSCSVVIDGEAYRNIAIRAKGNTSLSNVASMNSDRYSFKIEFDHYDNTASYYGLDKLCLNNVIQDNTYMKDFLAYTMMYEFGVAAPMCSFAYLTVNGEDWGLYLAVEAVEDSFMLRNYRGEGELYKPDRTNMGGGRGNGKDFRMEDVEGFEDFFKNREDTRDENTSRPNGQMPNMGNFGGQRPDVGGMTPPGGAQQGNRPNMGGDFGGQIPGGFGGGMGSSDVKLQYVDDNPESYSSIFDNAKTDISEKDKARLISSLKSLSKYENLENTVDAEQVIAYFVVHNFVDNGDSYTGSMVHNYYLRENDGRLSMIPWDYNLAYGTFRGSNASSSVNAPIDSPVSGNENDRPMVGWIFSDEQYTRLYHQYFDAFIEKFFDSGWLEELIDDTAEMIAPYVKKDPTKFCTYEEFLLGVDTIQSYCLLRAESVKGQLDGTIPSTAEGQRAAPSALVDTANLNLSDMGTMSHGGGRF
ncbi:MAG: CotH kinase family protein [Clostridia bacterium]|nr:CotH kinase family protein [Clostridia bacterium]